MGSTRSLAQPINGQDESKMTEQQVKKRNRGVLLDSALIRLKAKERGWTQLHQFQQAYDEANNVVAGKTETAPEKVWKGTAIDLKYANKVAKVFGLSDHYGLLYVGERSGWDALLNNPSYRSDEPIVDLFVDDESWRNIDLGLLDQVSEKALKTYSVKGKWQLYLFGRPKAQFAVFLLSQKHVSQILPSTHSKLPSSIPPSGMLVVPEEPVLQFDQTEALGKRTLIAIRAEHIPLMPRTEHSGHIISQLELEQFAIHLQSVNKGNIAVTVLPFCLVSEGETSPL